MKDDIIFTKIEAKEIIPNQNDDKILIQDLFYYIEKNNEEKIISYLRDKSLKIWLKKDEDDFTILHKSCFLNNTSISFSIITETKNRIGYSPTFNAFINAKTEEGLTALHYAAYKGNLELSKFLLQNGADVTAVTKLGKNVIHWTAEGNQPSLMIFYLFKRVIDISTQDYNKSTPLHWACYSGAYDSIKFLLSLNAEINAIDKNELTPLHLATLYGKKDIIILLLQNGAIKDISNSRGETPLYLAWKKKYKEIYNILNKNEYYPLWTIKEPYEYIKPNDIYKKYIIIIFIVHQVIIIILILPYLKSRFDIIFNNCLFLLDLLLFLLLIKKDPGYKTINKKTNKIDINNISINSYNNYPLLDLIEKNEDIRNYCPKCFILLTKGIKHCIFCEKCVEGYRHHCFWINKCIGKNNFLIYFFFILITLIFAFDSTYICLITLFSFTLVPYDKLIYSSIIRTLKERQIRVFFASLIGVFSIFVSFPICFLFFYEIYKCFINNKDCCDKIKNKKINKMKEKFELATKNVLFEEDDEDNINLNINDENRDTNNTNKEMNLISEKIFKDVNIEESDILSQSSKNSVIPIAQTPILKNDLDNKKNNLLFDESSEG